MTNSSAILSSSPAEAQAEPVDERQAFEAWARSEGVDVSCWISGKPDRGYDNGRTCDYWTGWQARAALSIPAQPAQAQGEAQKQQWWLVLDEAGYPIHSAGWESACHEHINDAINEFGLDEAKQWRVVQAFASAAPPAPPAVEPSALDRAKILAMACDAGLRTSNPGAAQEVMAFAELLLAANSQPQAAQNAADAARYRWLQERTVATGLSRWMGHHQFLDAAIDAELRAGGASPSASEQSSASTGQ